MKKNGFTLIELLATLVILAIIMLVAVPSTISVLDKNKRENFMSDAKRFVALAESEIRNNEKLDVAYNGVIVFSLSELNDGSFDADADGTKYNENISYVIAHKKGSATDYAFEYYVQLFGENRGIKVMRSSALVRDSIVSIPTGLATKNFQTEITDALSSLSISSIVGSNIVYYQG